MKLTEFTKGAIIHRVKSNEKSSSFVEDPIVFIDMKSGLLFYKYVDLVGLDKRTIYRVEIEKYNDDFWDYFPTDYLVENE